jgi:hypothetical protein
MSEIVVIVIRPGEENVVLDVAGTLTAEPLIPGFRLALVDLFKE